MLISSNFTSPPLLDWSTVFCISMTLSALSFVVMVMETSSELGSPSTNCCFKNKHATRRQRKKLDLAIIGFYE